MEIYNNLETKASKEFKDLLNSQLSKTKDLAEGKIIEGKITKVTEKFVFLFIEGLKSEPVIDVNELKSMGLSDQIKLGSKISVLLERIEDKNGVLLNVLQRNSSTDFNIENPIFVIDPYGRAVMYFDSKTDPKLILKDLKVLI